ncbi:hypothetical protein KL858_31065 [Mycolicibacterium goodii]|uniref:Lipoprotein n=2 Tax=Mycolicibacterium goodii TaxID=134601 RepID=A0ABS6I190_MYCGD|nr:hypothetical protein [Mycolicibacterium goodii]MBU8819004.1 hypothetical protein [Mycolicibacterium goodii]MBU8827557.1 hypothetical protein [Mycolicibacterium goodii]MBU8833866.1 hypothetical protein [Mycolicibacterium goodii]MBU8841171.1 hypothetical protein [Mycolicibacterium goodii]
MKPIKPVILAAAMAAAAGGMLGGVTSGAANAEPTTPAPAPAPAPAPGSGTGPAPGPAPDAAAALDPTTVMDHDGVFVVGADIQPGTYATGGPAEGATCYWKRMADLHGGDIIDNAFTKQPDVVQIEPTDKAFKTSGCQPWQKTDAAPTDTPTGAGAPGDIPGLIAKAKLRSWLDSINAGARQFDGSQVPLP